MSDYILKNGVLYHHGIKGQKWGERRYQNADGSYTPNAKDENGGHGRYYNGTADSVKNAKAAYKQAKKDYSRSYDEAYRRSHSIMNITKSGRVARDAAIDKAYNDARKVKEAKTKYKEEKQKYKENQRKETKKTVKEYTKQFDKASNMEDKSDELFRKAKEQHKALGNTPLSRMKAVSEAQKGRGSKAAKEYLKTWNEANKLGDKAYDEWQKADELYKKTGKNKLSRILNNVKYS